MEICELDTAAYRGKAIRVQYTISHVYETVVSQDAVCSSVMFQRTALPKPLSYDSDDVWGSEWLKRLELYSVCVDGQVAGLLEVCMENQTQRLQITDLFIEPAYRGRGCATCLLEHVRQLTIQRGIRCVLLEAQSCNDPVIQYYLRSGFVLLGCDLSVASNQDIQGKNVRIEMGCYLQLIGCLRMQGNRTNPNSKGTFFQYTFRLRSFQAHFQATFLSDIHIIKGMFSLQEKMKMLYYMLQDV